MSSTPRADAFAEAIRAEFPAFRIVPKRESAVCRVIDVALRVLTLGGQREFLTRYHTVLRDTLYVPEIWEREDDVTRLVLLRHERVHLRQRRRLGDVAMTLLYLVPFFPLGLAYGRARIEWEAYEETLAALAELRGLDVATSDETRAYLRAQFVGPAYGWMWPFPRTIDAWIDAALARIVAERSAAERG